MKKRVGWTLLCVVLILGNIFFIFFMRKDRQEFSFPETRTEELSALQEKRVSLLLHWRTSESAVLSQLEIPEIAATITHTNCDVSHPASSVSAPDLSAEQQADATAVMTGLMAVYAEYNAESQLAFWNSRGLELNPAKMGELRTLLQAAPEASDLGVDGLSNDDLFRVYFKVAGLKSHWKSVVVEASCANYWSAVPMSAIFEGLGANDKEVFSNLNTYYSFFQPKQQQDVASSVPRAEAATTIFMDVKLVIQYDASKSESISSYCIRFWWDKDRLSWQPLIMTSVATDSTTPPRIMF